MPANLKLAQTPLPVINTEAEVRLANERPEDGAMVMALVDRAFGPGRYAKSSERVREGNHMLRNLSFCAFGAGALVGTVRQWPITIGEVKGVFLGPIAVEGAWRQHGVGGLLVDRCCEAAAEAGEPFILLVGDIPFFGPHGFEPVPEGRVQLPSPVNRRRILWRALRGGGTDGVAGDVRAARV